MRWSTKIRAKVLLQQLNNKKIRPLSWRKHRRVSSWQPFLGLQRLWLDLEHWPPLTNAADVGGGFINAGALAGTSKVVSDCVCVCVCVCVCLVFGLFRLVMFC